MANKNFFLQRNYECVKKYNAIILEDLPEFSREFFIGVESTTTPLTRLNYAYDLRVFFDFLTKKVPTFLGRPVKKILLSDLDAITATDIENYLSYLSYYTPPKHEKSEIVSNSERGKSRKLSTVRAFFKYYGRKGKLQKNAAVNVATPKIRDKEIIRLQSSEIPQLLDLVEFGEIGSDHQNNYNRKNRLRDLAILTLFLGTGIRISELVGINLEDVDLKNNTFVVTRKGGSRSNLYYSDEIKMTLMAYLEKRYSDAETPLSGHDPFFISMQNKRISVRAVENLVNKYSRHITLKKITPHKLRSTFGTELYQSTSDIGLVADVLGHKDINTTRKHYAALSEESRRRASAKVTLRDEKGEKKE